MIWIIARTNIRLSGKVQKWLQWSDFVQQKRKSGQKIAMFLNNDRNFASMELRRPEQVPLDCFIEFVGGERHCEVALRSQLLLLIILLDSTWNTWNISYINRVFFSLEISMCHISIHSRCVIWMSVHFPTLFLLFNLNSPWDFYTERFVLDTLYSPSNLDYDLM